MELLAIFFYIYILHLCKQEEILVALLTHWCVGVVYFGLIGFFKLVIPF